MINIAAVIDNLGPSQKSFYLVKEFNKSSSARNLCTSVFFQRAAIPVTGTLFSCRSISFLSGFHHNAIATTIGEANVLLKSNNAAKKFLYLWDLEWLRNPTHYDISSKILLDDRIHIIARSDEHAKMIDNFCNKMPIAVVDNWHLESLVKVVQDVGK